MLDVHAAGGGGDKGNAAAGAIHKQGEIKLALDIGSALHEDAAHDAAFWAGLRRDERLAEQAVRLPTQFLDGLDQLDAATLAAAAGVDLRLHHPKIAKILGV